MSPKEREKTNHKRIRADDTVICFTEVRFLQTYSPLRWSQRPGLFQPFPSLKRSPRLSEPLSSIKWDTKSTTNTTTTWCLLFWLQVSWTQEKRKKKSNPSARAQMNTSISLSLVTIWLELSLDLGEDLISCLCLVLNVIALIWGVKAENLDPMNGGWLGVLIAPTTKGAIGGGCCRMAHRTVPCATGHCPVRQPRHPAVGFWPLELLTSGPPNSLMVHRTVTVHCPVRLLAPVLTSACAGAHCSTFIVLADDRWRCVAVTPLAHRTVRCYTGQSGEL
jgi:hypothetical protein